MSSPREKMINAIQETIVPVLRQSGFKGTFPHFYRIAGENHDLLMFQFNKHGGGFWVEVGSSRGDPSASAPSIRVYDIQIEMRRRIGHRTLGYMDPEFRFEKTPWFGAKEYTYDATAASVLPYLHKEAEDFWAGARKTFAEESKMQNKS